jgi:hypothetical protein
MLIENLESTNMRPGRTSSDPLSEFFLVQLGKAREREGKGLDKDHREIETESGAKREPANMSAGRGKSGWLSGILSSVTIQCDPSEMLRVWAPLTHLASQPCVADMSWL